jgi:hypothetical protein
MPTQPPVQWVPGVNRGRDVSLKTHLHLVRVGAIFHFLLGAYMTERDSVIFYSRETLCCSRACPAGDVDVCTLVLMFLLSCVHFRIFYAGSFPLSTVCGIIEVCESKGVCSDRLMLIQTIVIAIISLEISRHMNICFIYLLCLGI